MKRKHFIKQAAGLAPLLVAFNPLAAFRHHYLTGLTTEGAYKKRILVLIELSGGNDGLNTIIPIDKYPILSQPNARRDILIPENKILPLFDTNAFGFHPAMAGLQSLYNNQLMTVVHGVGYPNPEFSHFEGLGIKYTARIDRQNTDGKSGWIGRHLQYQFANYPLGYPMHKDDGPPAIRFGEVSSVVTQFVPPIKQDIDDFSIGITNLSDLDAIAAAPAEDPVGNTRAGANIRKIRAIANQVRIYSPVILNYSKRKANLSGLYPQDQKNPLADQLKTVARLIGSGLNTPIYVVYQTGYDTHADQVDKSDTSQGAHARLLKDFSEAVTAFQDDLQLMGKQDDVLTMTFSEFGRRIASGSYGTDHGTADTVMLFGSKLNHRMIGTSPILPDKVTFEDNLQVQVDFRSLYKTVLRDWFGVATDRVSNIIPQGPEEKIDLLKS